MPNIVDVGPDASVELGVKFKSDVNGNIVGVRFYKSAANVGPHVVNLWNSSRNAAGDRNFDQRDRFWMATGEFCDTVPITANTVYVASYL